MSVPKVGKSELPAEKHDSPSAHPPAKKATLGQVMATMFWGMCMIGKKGTWERDGAKLTLPQAIVGAVIAGCVVVALLVLLARFAVR
jgi:hypothetical protein